MENNPQEQIDKLNQKLDELIAQNLYEEAIRLAKKIVKFTNEIKGEESHDFALSLDNLGWMYKAKGDYVSAKRLLKQALEIRRKVLGEKHPDFVLNLSNLGYLYQTMSEYGFAKQKYKQALEITRNVLGEEHPDFASCLNDLGWLHTALGNYVFAERLLEEALEINRKVLGEEHPDFASCLNNLGWLYHLLGNNTSAEHLLKQALEITRKVLGEEHSGFASTLDNLGRMYSSMNEYTSAKRSLKQALEIRRKILGEKHPDFVLSLSHLGEVYYKLAEYDFAEHLLKQALEITRKVLGEEHIHFALSLNTMGCLYGNMGENVSAELLFKQSLGITRKILGENHPNLASILFNLATVYTATQREHESLLLMEQASFIDDEIIEQLFTIGTERQCLDFLKTIEKHFYLFLSLLLNCFSHSTDVVNTAYQLILKRKGIVLDLLSKQHDTILNSKYPELALSLKMLTDLRMQIANKTFSGPGPEGSVAHQRFLKYLKTEKEKLEANLVKEIPEIKFENRLNSPDTKVISSLIPNDAALIEFVKFNVFNFKAVVANGEKLWSSPRYLAFIVSHDGEENIKMIDLGEAETIDKLISDYRAEIINNFSENPKRDMLFSQTKVNPSNNSDTWYKLRAILYDPLLEAIGNAKRLLIAPDGNLSIQSFEIIPLENGRYLIDDYQISYLSVGRDLERFKPEQIMSSSKPLIIADPNFDFINNNETNFQQFNDKITSIPIHKKHQELKPNYTANILSPMSHEKSKFIARDFRKQDITFNRLPGTIKEGEEIARMLEVKPMMGNLAVESLIKKYSSPKILHIATHGFFLIDQKIELDNDQMVHSMSNFETDFGTRHFSASKIKNPMHRSGLALAGINTWLKGDQPPAEAEDGILTAEDVTGLNLAATELVVLSACETGLGEIQTGEGVFGLRRAFTIAGAKTLVMSLWKVPDKQTKELMINFYQRLINGEARSDALRNAQLDIRKQYPDPYYWGAFICQGDPGPFRENYNSQTKE